MSESLPGYDRWKTTPPWDRDGAIERAEREEAENEEAAFMEWAEQENARHGVATREARHG